MTWGEGPRPPATVSADERRAITIRLPNETLATLQFLSAAIRRSSGAALGSSAIVRSLITRLAEIDIDTRRVKTLDDLRAVLSSKLAASLPGRGETRARG